MIPEHVREFQAQVRNYKQTFQGLSERTSVGVCDLIKPLGNNDTSSQHAFVRKHLSQVRSCVVGVDNSLAGTARRNR